MFFFLLVFFFLRQDSSHYIVWSTRVDVKKLCQTRKNKQTGISFIFPPTCPKTKGTFFSKSAQIIMEFVHFHWEKSISNFLNRASLCKEV